MANNTLIEEYIQQKIKEINDKEKKIYDDLRDKLNETNAGLAEEEETKKLHKIELESRLLEQTTQRMALNYESVTIKQTYDELNNEYQIKQAQHKFLEKSIEAERPTIDRIQETLTIVIKDIQDVTSDIKESENSLRIIEEQLKVIAQKPQEKPQDMDLLKKPLTEQQVQSLTKEISELKDHMTQSNELLLALVEEYTSFSLTSTQELEELTIKQNDELKNIEKETTSLQKQHVLTAPSRGRNTPTNFNLTSPNLKIAKDNLLNLRKEHADKEAAVKEKNEKFKREIQSIQTSQEKARLDLQELEKLLPEKEHFGILDRHKTELSDMKVNLSADSELILLEKKLQIQFKLSALNKKLIEATSQKNELVDIIETSQIQIEELKSQENALRTMEQKQSTLMQHTTSVSETLLRLEQDINSLETQIPLLTNEIDHELDQIHSHIQKNATKIQIMDSIVPGNKFPEILAEDLTENEKEFLNTQEEKLLRLAQILTNPINRRDHKILLDYINKPTQNNTRLFNDILLNLMPSTENIDNVLTLLLTLDDAEDNHKLRELYCNILFNWNNQEDANLRSRKQFLLNTLSQVLDLSNLEQIVSDTKEKCNTYITSLESTIMSDGGARANLAMINHTDFIFVINQPPIHRLFTNENQANIIKYKKVSDALLYLDQPNTSPTEMLIQFYGAINANPTNNREHKILEKDSAWETFVKGLKHLGRTLLIVPVVLSKKKTGTYYGMWKKPEEKLKEGLSHKVITRNPRQ